jgi:hypothetical protein
MSCTGEETKLGCGQNPYPFNSTSLEPLKWNRVRTTYITIGGEQYASEVCYYLRTEAGDILQFRHEIEYDADGNVTQLDVY